MTQPASTTTTTASGDATLALDSISVRENVRDLDAEHVAALAQSIKLRGLLVPVIVRAVDGGHELVAGYHRFAACRQLGLDEIAVVVREHEGSSADSAAENVTRKQLTPARRGPRRPGDARRGLHRRRRGAGARLERDVAVRAVDLQALRRRTATRRDRALPLGAIDNLLAVGDVSAPWSTGRPSSPRSRATSSAAATSPATRSRINESRADAVAAIVAALQRIADEASAALA